LREDGALFFLHQVAILQMPSRGEQTPQRTQRRESKD